MNRPLFRIIATIVLLTGCSSRRGLTSGGASQDSCPSLSKYEERLRTPTFEGVVRASLREETGYESVQEFAFFKNGFVISTRDAESQSVVLEDDSGHYESEAPLPELAGGVPPVNPVLRWPSSFQGPIARVNRGDFAFSPFQELRKNCDRVLLVSPETYRFDRKILNPTKSLMMTMKVEEFPTLDQEFVAWRKKIKVCPYDKALIVSGRTCP
jgi:hypothetical protein